MLFLLTCLLLTVTNSGSVWADAVPRHPNKAVKSRAHQKVRAALRQFETLLHGIRASLLLPRFFFLQLSSFSLQIVFAKIEDVFMDREATQRGDMASLRVALFSVW